jgi:hypothetical protein
LLQLVFKKSTAFRFVPKQRSVLPCIPPEHPSNFHFGGPNRKNRVEEKRIEKSWIFQIIIR